VESCQNQLAFKGIAQRLDRRRTLQQGVDNQPTLVRVMDCLSSFSPSVEQLQRTTTRLADRLSSP
jgi:hypothetical protein